LPIISPLPPLLLLLCCLQTKSAGWSVQGDIVVLPQNAFNTAVQKRTQDLIGFDSVAPVLKQTVVSV
jgi:hypothetical protein